MSSRIPLPYSQRVIELFKNPVNLGKMDDATVFAQAGSPACGDMIAFYLKIDEKKKKSQNPLLKALVVHQISQQQVK